MSAQVLLLGCGRQALRLLCQTGCCSWMNNSCVVTLDISLYCWKHLNTWTFERLFARKSDRCVANISIKFHQMLPKYCSSHNLLNPKKILPNVSWTKMVQCEHLNRTRSNVFSDKARHKTNKCDKATVACGWKVKHQVISIQRKIKHLLCDEGYQHVFTHYGCVKCPRLPKKSFERQLEKLLGLGGGGGKCNLEKSQ